jgi:hypothetical protein
MRLLDIECLQTGKWCTFFAKDSDLQERGLSILWRKPAKTRQGEPIELTIEKKIYRCSQIIDALSGIKREETKKPT